MRPCYPASLHGETGAGAFLEIHPQPRPDLLVQVAFEVLAPSLGGDFAQAQHVDVLGHLHYAAQVVGHAHVGKQARLLRDVPDAAIDEPVRGDAGHVGAVVTDGSRLRAQKTAEGLHQRGLACAVQADEPGDSARLHAERDVAQDIDVGGVAGGDGGHFEQRAHAAASSSPPRYASITERSVSTVRVGPSAMTAPAFMQIVRGQSSTITGMSWLTTRNVCPPAWCAR